MKSRGAKITSKLMKEVFPMKTNIKFPTLDSRLIANISSHPTLTKLARLIPQGQQHILDPKILRSLYQVHQDMLSAMNLYQRDAHRDMLRAFMKANAPQDDDDDEEEEQDW